MQNYKTTLVFEAFESRKFQPGKIKFTESKLTDSYIKNIIAALAKAMNTTPAEIEKIVQSKMDEFQALASQAPLLYGTISKNIVEGEVFKLMEQHPIETNAPRFSTVTFNKLIRSIRADHDEFFPLRSFIDTRRLLTPKIEFVGGEEPGKTKYQSIDTAAATPTGEFIFNVKFMQSLIDFAHMKGVKPKGKKYVSSGGDIPDEYCYIEFLIMHEFMHFSNDDFYYQHIIPNANPQIINWVGDFRTNYLLVKSGYEQLPMGLFNDDINYDRQKTYVEMYNLVKSQMEKLQDQQKGSDALDEQSDEHEPGQQEGKEQGTPEKADGSKPTTGDIDENAAKVKGQMQGGKDAGKEERKASEGESKDTSLEGNHTGQPGSGSNSNIEVDYTKVKPTFNWKTLIKRFVSSAKPKTEETYAKPHRRSVTGVVVASQRGAAAIKPAEKPLEHNEKPLAFVIDSSGSMSDVIAQAFATVVSLLRAPAFKKLNAYVMKFSSGHEAYLVNFASNKAAKLNKIEDKVPQMTLNAKSAFVTHLAGGTEFKGGIVNDTNHLLQKKFNVIFFLDSDIFDGSHFNNFLTMIHQHPKQVFVIFNNRATYIEFRQKAQLSTPNITYFS